MSIRPLKRVPFRQGSSVDQQVAPERSMDPRPVVEALPVEQSIIDNGLYTDGHRTDSPATLAETFRLLRTRPDSMAWIGLYRPAESQILAVAEEFGLHELAVEDAIVAHQRPKLERYGDTLFVVLRPARYLDAAEEVDFGELHVFLGPDFVLSVRHSEVPNLAAVRRRMEGDPSCCVGARRQCCTRSWTRLWTATPRWLLGCRTTSTRSKPRSSAAIRRCRGVSTSCPAR
jgi:magnesium transporter